MATKRCLVEGFNSLNPRWYPGLKEATSIKFSCALMFSPNLSINNSRLWSVNEWMATITSGLASAISSKYKIEPSFTAVVKGPSNQTVSAPLIIKRPIKSVEDVSSWQEIVFNFVPSLWAIYSINLDFPVPVGPFNKNGILQV